MTDDEYGPVARFGWVTVRRWVAIVAISGTFLLGAFARGSIPPKVSPASVPAPEDAWPCEEDAALVGRGSFDGKAWEHYVCIPLDDIARSGP